MADKIEEIVIKQEELAAKHKEFCYNLAENLESFIGSNSAFEFTAVGSLIKVMFRSGVKICEVLNNHHVCHFIKKIVSVFSQNVTHFGFFLDYGYAIVCIATNKKNLTSEFDVIVRDSIIVLTNMQFPARFEIANAYDLCDVSKNKPSKATLEAYFINSMGELDKAKKKKNKLQKQVEKLTMQNSILIDQAKTNEREKALKCSELANADGKLASLTAKLDAAEEKIASLTSELSTAEEKIACLSADLEKAKTNRKQHEKKIVEEKPAVANFATVVKSISPVPAAADSPVVSPPKKKGAMPFRSDNFRFSSSVYENRNSTPPSIVFNYHFVDSDGNYLTNNPQYTWIAARDVKEIKSNKCNNEKNGKCIYPFCGFHPDMVRRFEEFTFKIRLDDSSEYRLCRETVQNFKLMVANLAATKAINKRMDIIADFINSLHNYESEDFSCSIKDCEDMHITIAEI